jgi:CheY-like chemotaxis protein
MTLRDPTTAVLLVEDEPDDVLLARRAFAKAGIAAPLHVVGDGEAAVAYLAGTGAYADRLRYPVPGLMLLDLKLPRLGGLEVLRWVRAQPPLRRLPVVVLTASKENVDLERAYDLGANSYLVKPVSFDGMIELSRALGLYWLTLNEPPPPAAPPLPAPAPGEAGRA